MLAHSSPYLGLVGRESALEESPETFKNLARCHVVVLILRSLRILFLALEKDLNRSLQFDYKLAVIAGELSTQESLASSQEQLSRLNLPEKISAYCIRATRDTWVR